MSRGVAGRTVLLTRDEGLADAVRALGAEVILAEVLRHEAVPAEVALSDYDWIVFTSRRAVAFLDAPLDEAPPIACVGRATAEEVERRGGEVALVPDRADARSLAVELVRRTPLRGLREPEVGCRVSLRVGSGARTRRLDLEPLRGVQYSPAGTFRAAPSPKG